MVRAAASLPAEAEGEAKASETAITTPVKSVWSIAAAMPSCVSAAITAVTKSRTSRWYWRGSHHVRQSAMPECEIRPRTTSATMAPKIMMSAATMTLWQVEKHDRLEEDRDAREPDDRKRGQ